MTAYPFCIVRFGLTMVKCFHFQLNQLRMESGQLLVFARRLSGPKEEAGVYTSSECLTKRSKLGTLSSGVAVACRILRWIRSEEHTSELQSLAYLVCRLLLEKKKKKKNKDMYFNRRQKVIKIQSRITR